MLRPGRQVHLSGQSLAFRGCKPHISLDCSQARGRSVRRALDQGHFYLQVEKKGSIFRQTTCPAYQTCTVSPDWVTGLWQGDKINKECAEQHYVQCKRNIGAYCENLKYHGQKQRELYIQQQQAAAAELLRPLQKEPVELPEVTQLFLPQFGFVLSPSIAAPFWMRRCCFHTACFVLQGQCFLAASALSIPEVCRPRHSHVEC